VTEEHAGCPIGQVPFMGETWRYHFDRLLSEDYSRFLDRVREKVFAGWKSGLMQSLKAELEWTGS
jgi:hypothetical protein